MCSHFSASFTRHILPHKNHKHIPEHKVANILIPPPREGQAGKGLKPVPLVVR